METLSILVVDDEPGIRSGVLRILKGHTVSFPFMDDDYRFDCREAASGEEALEMLEDAPPDILLLDNKLPGIDGMEVLEIIKQKKMDIMVAMITSYASLEIAAKATDDGAWDFIPKPFTPAELLEFHDTRNKIYHEGISILPIDSNLDKIDQASEWIFKNILETHSVCSKRSLYSQ